MSTTNGIFALGNVLFYVQCVHVSLDAKKTVVSTWTWKERRLSTLAWEKISQTRFNSVFVQRERCVHLFFRFKCWKKAARETKANTKVESIEIYISWSVNDFWESAHIFIRIWFFFLSFFSTICLSFWHMYMGTWLHIWTYRYIYFTGVTLYPRNSEKLYKPFILNYFEWTHWRQRERASQREKSVCVFFRIFFFVIVAFAETGSIPIIFPIFFSSHTPCLHCNLSKYKAGLQQQMNRILNFPLMYLFI